MLSYQEGVQVNIEKKTKSIWIEGTWRDIDGQTEIIYNPATLKPITEVAYDGKKETEEAIQAATRALVSWSGTTGRDRAIFLYKASQLMMEDAERLGEVLTLEQGKPLHEAIGEVKSAAAFLLWYAEEASRGYGEWIPSSNQTKRLLVIPKPIGVVGAITPWNFPSSMITRKIAPALAAGCTLVLKPAPETPLSAIEIMKIFQRAGIPDGVVNLVTGDAKAIGKSLLESKDVRLITFTGSTSVGKYLIQESAKHVKKLSLELGGHAPSIIFEDADIERAAALVLGSKFRNNGQTCICTNRLYVHESIAEKFTAKLTEKVQQLKIGCGMEIDTQLGPLINKKALEKVHAHLEDAVIKGAKVICGGAPWTGNLGDTSTSLQFYRMLRMK